MTEKRHDITAQKHKGILLERFQEPFTIVTKLRNKNNFAICNDLDFNKYKENLVDVRSVQ